MRRLYAVRTFLSAEVAPDLSRVPKGDTIVDVRVIVTEDLMRSGTVEPAVGTLDCLRVRGNYTDKAFLRGTNRLDVSASLSKIGLAKPTQAGALYDACRWLRDLPNDETDPSISALNYSANVSLTRPLPLPGGLLPSVSAYRERRGAYQAYLRTTLIGGALSVNKLITRNIAFEGSYNLEYGNTKAAPTVLCFLFRACDEASREQIADSNRVLAVIGTRFSRDRRNSADSASDGGFVRLDLRAASPLILSDKSLTFQKGVIDAAWYQRMGPGVVAVRARAGLIGGGQATDFARFAPPQERLYVGGENSVRGFRQNELGPVIYVTSNDSARAQAVIDAPTETIRDSLLQAMTVRVIPTGGNAMYVGNLEYRLSLPFVRGLQTVAFLDVGALSQSGIQTINGSNQFRFTPGVAIKYFSPVGPVQINFGYNKYNPVAGAVYSDQFTDASGQAFLKCLREESPGGRCLPLPAIAPQTKWFRRITLSVAFPPDF
jgi:outer membrane protein insertion porin family/translocation and assembly module TamA